MANNPNDLQFPLFDHSGPNGNVWLASTLRLYRNLDRYKFAGKLDMEKRKEILSHLSDALTRCSSLKNPRFYGAEALTPIDKEYLFEQFLSTQGFSRAHAGEGFVVDDTGRFLAILNVREHLQLHLMETNGELETAWNELVKIETELSQSLSFAFNSQFGFLAAESAHSGTGLIVNVFLHIPALCHTNTLQQIRGQFEEEDVAIGTLLENSEDLVGHVINVRNRFCLGVNEEKIISNLRTAAMKIMVAENAARSSLKEQNNLFIKDRISRSLGLLTHSFQLQTIETLDAISMLILGSSIGMVEGIKAEELDRLFFTCRRAHLAKHFQSTTEQEDYPQKRADLLRDGLGAIQLVN